MLMALTGWIAVGLIAGFIITKIVDLRGDDPRLGIAIGGVGGALGGWLYCHFSNTAAISFSLISLIYAALTAVGAMVIWRSWRGSSAA